MFITLMTIDMAMESPILFYIFPFCFCDDIPKFIPNDIPIKTNVNIHTINLLNLF